MVNPAPMAGILNCANASKAGTSEVNQTRRPEMDLRGGRSGSCRERDNDYRGIIACLSPQCRVIVCHDGLQWIVQRRDGQRSGWARWAGAHYFRTRDALLRFCRTSCERIHPAAWASLGALPDIIGAAT